MLYILLIINLITFTVYALDKWKAAKRKRRISESTLLSFTFFGGTVGAVCAMLMFRHKISKKGFLWKLLGMIILQVLFLLGCWKFDIKVFNS